MGAFAKPHLRRLTIHPVTDGLTLYVTPTLQGSRGGALIAGAWATMLHGGHGGYLAAAKSMNDLKLKVEKEVQSIPGLSLPVPSDLCIIPMGSDGSFDIYKVMCENVMWSRDLAWSIFLLLYFLSGGDSDGEKRMV